MAFKKGDKPKNPLSSDPKSPRSAAEAGRKGGTQKGLNRVAAGRLRERLLAYASTPCEDDQTMTKEDAMAIALINKAVDGDAKAMDQYAELTDQRVIKTESKVSGIDIQFNGVFSEDGDKE